MIDFLFDIIRSRHFYLFTIVFLLYTCGTWQVNSDTLPAQLLPVSIIREHDFDLDEFRLTSYRTSLDEGNTVISGGRMMSRYPVFTPLISTPFYIPYILAGYDMETYYAVPACISSVFFVSLSVVFLYMALSLVTNNKRALYCSLIYAFGTCTWSISSSDMWQHGSAQLFLAVSMYFLLRGLNERRFIPYAGFSLACMVASRPADMLIFLAVAAYVFSSSRKMFPSFILWYSPPFLFLSWYSWSYLGTIYALGQGQYPFLGWTTPLYYGLSSILFSPSKGLFVYSPVLLLSFVGIYRVWKDGGNLFFKYLSITVFAVILMWSKWWAWHGALSYGYRMLLDITPVLCLFLVPALERYDRLLWFRRMLALLVVYSVLVQIVGVLSFDGTWDVVNIGSYYSLDSIDGAYWRIEDNQLLYYFRRVVNTF